MSILIQPLLTEKSTSLATQGKYSFCVRRTAAKLTIKQEIEQRYGVKVQSINTLNLPPRRTQRYMQRRVLKGIKPLYKKAIVQLKEGDIIDFYDTKLSG